MIRLIATFVLSTACGVAWAAEIFVSPTGNDRHPGTREQPFATLERARDEARKTPGPRRVVLRGGKYYLTRALTLEPQDSGLTVEVARGEAAMLSGGREVTGWRPFRGKIWLADLAGLDLPDCWFRELYSGGHRQSLARVPNFDVRHPRIGGFLYSCGVVEPGTKTKLRYRSGELDPARWTHSERALVVFHDALNYEQTWSALKQVDPVQRVIEAARGVYVLAADCPYYVCGLLEELDAPGEWYVDPEREILYFWPPCEQSPPSAVTVPALDSLIVLRGDAAAGRWVENVRLARLALGECRVQAVMIHAARGCTVAACELRNVGSGVHLGDDTHACQVLGCDITQTLGDGVSILGTSVDHDRVSHHVVDNNYIWDFGWGKNHNRCGGVYMHRCAHCRVTHNHIHDGPRYAIGMDVGNDCEIAYNHAHHVNLTTADTGIIEAATALDWRFPIDEQLRRNRQCNWNNTIHHNLLYDSGGFGRGASSRFEYPVYSWGIYLDLACSGWRVHDNVCYRTVLGGFMLNAGQDNVVENNVFVGGRQNQIQFNPWPKHPMSGHRCQRNVVAYEGAAALYTLHRFTNEFCRFSQNLIHSASGQPRIVGIVGGTRRENWNDWLATGQDQGSRLADPGFVDPAAGDYRLRPDSPALKLGFQPIDLSGVGNYASPDRRTWPRPEVRLVREPADYRPATELAPQQPERRDYEKVEPGATESQAHVGDGGRGGGVAVTDETAASGKHSLKFTDAAGLKQVYAPFLTYPLEVDRGVERAGFDLRLEAGSKLVYEWRDDPYRYNLGPRLEVDAQGWLKANGRRLVQLPHGQWLRIDLACGLGPLATGRYDLTLRLPDAEPQLFPQLACSPKFKSLACVVVMSMADGPAVFYLDNLEFRHSWGAIPLSSPAK